MHGRPGRACTCGVVDFLGFEFEDDGDSSCGQDGGQHKPPQLFIWGRGTRRTRPSVSIWCDVRLPHLRLTKGQSSDVAAAEPRSLDFRPLTALLHGLCIAVQSFIPQIIKSGMIQPSEVAESVGWANGNLSNYCVFFCPHIRYM